MCATDHTHYGVGFSTKESGQGATAPLQETMSLNNEVEGVSTEKPGS